MVLAATIVLAFAALTAGAMLSRLRVEASFDGAVRSRARWLAFGVDYGGTPREVRVSLFGVPVFRRAVATAREGRRVEGNEGVERRPSRVTGSGWLREWRPLRRATVGLLRRVSWERLEVDAEFGTDDPALTGMLYGFVCAVGEPLATAPNVHVRVEPDFVDERLEGRAATAFSIRMAHLIVFAIRMARIGRRRARGRA